MNQKLKETGFNGKKSVKELFICAQNKISQSKVILNYLIDDMTVKYKLIFQVH